MINLKDDGSVDATYLGRYGLSSVYCNPGIIPKTINLDSINKIVERSIDSSSRTFRAHLIKNNAHYAVFVDVVKMEDPSCWGGKIVVLKDVQLLNYMQASYEYDGVPEIERDWVASMESYVQVEENDSVKKEEDEKTVSDIPKTFSLSNHVVVSLSDEMIQNMEGMRGSDHCISLELVEECAERKKGALKRLIGRKDFNFRLSKSDTRILNMIFHSYNRMECSLVTAYFMTQLQIKDRAGAKSDVVIEAWKNNPEKVTTLD